MKIQPTLLITSLLFLLACKDEGNQLEVSTSTTERADNFTIVGEKNFLSGYEPLDSFGNVNVVIEIPTGTTAKWEVEKPSGNLKWEFIDGAPREVNYLGYPGNYGMIPRTLLPKDMGGDGDPLDVIVLGNAVERGAVLKTRIIGMLRLLDRGEQDDKLVAVVENSPFSEIKNLEELDSNFNGIRTIIETFFTNYKGPKKMEPLGWSNEIEAEKILEFSIEAYQKKVQ